MQFSKQTIFITAAFLIVILIIWYGVSTNKQPSPEFVSQEEASDQGIKEEESPQNQGSQQPSQQTVNSPRPAQEGSFGLKIDSPKNSDSWYRGAKHTLQWSGLFTDRVRISLRRTSTSFNLLVLDNIYASVQKYEWTVPATLTPASDYYFVIVPLIQSYSKAATSATFKIADSLVVSASKSIVEPNPQSISAEPNCFSTITVKALNDYGLPVPGKKVSLSTERQGTIIVSVRDTTSADGTALFKVGSQIQGTAVLSAFIDGIKMNDTGSVSFLNPPPFCTTR
ncbi:hypothetical protein C4553_02900 [Candidatus Parcubacteria bacterium]|nr:MAG: hypothetical protein C4553_02900 [Candidatus Parcubacteria bacterium]